MRRTRPWEPQRKVDGIGLLLLLVECDWSTSVPVNDDTVDELREQSFLPPERFLNVLLDKVGYSTSLRDLIQGELKIAGHPITQITVLQGALREL